MNMLFISRHDPTSQQIALAKDKGFTLIPVGDRDAFASNLREDLIVLLQKNNATAIACVHPSIAIMAMIAGADKIGVFENLNRAKEGEKPSFTAASLHLYDAGEVSTTYRCGPGRLVFSKT